MLEEMVIGGNDKIINGVEIINPNRLFTNEEWQILSSWVMCYVQQINDRKRAIDKKVTEKFNKKRKTSAVRITTENQYLFA